MEQLPIMLHGNAVGELTLWKEGLYLRVEAVCRVRPTAPLTLFAVGDQGRLRLGVPAPERPGVLTLRRKISLREAGGAGTLRRGELAPCGEETGGWMEMEHPAELFRGPYLRQQLQGLEGVLTRKTGETREIAVPYDPEKPFPLTALFCLTRVTRIRGERYVIFRFDGREQPVL